MTYGDEHALSRAPPDPALRLPGDEDGDSPPSPRRMAPNELIQDPSQEATLFNCLFPLFVIDEFGNPSEVNSCSIPQGPAVFSANYKDCHVLEKDGRSHPRVFVEAVLPNGTLICPKPDHTWTPDSHLAPPTAFSLPAPHPPRYPLTQEQCQVASRHIPRRVRRSSKEAHQLAAVMTTPEGPCYYGNTATVQCFRNTHFVLVVSQETALACLFLQVDCIQHNQLVTNIGLWMRPQGSVTWDGTFLTQAGLRAWYSNLDAPILCLLSSILSNLDFRLHIHCVFNASDFLPLQAPLFPPPSSHCDPVQPLRLQLQIDKGKGEGDHSIVGLLQESDPMEVWLLQRTDPILVLVLHHANPFQYPQWPIQSGECPFGDSSGRMMALEGALPFHSHYQCFTVATFALLDTGSWRVYFLCGTSACCPSGLKTYSTTCSSGAAGHHNDIAIQSMVSSPGPLGFEDSYRWESTLGPAGSTMNCSPRPLLWVILLLLAVALVSGVGVFVDLSQEAQKLLEGNRRGGRHRLNGSLLALRLPDATVGTAARQVSTSAGCAADRLLVYDMGLHL
ncbi:LOW QUALITY PROTEIN: zona pellucida sperm-binding protein 1 [Megaptera novaeangliae]